MSASLASAPPSLEGVPDRVLCPPLRLVLLRPLEELLERPPELDLEGDLLLDLDRDTDRDLLLSLKLKQTQLTDLQSYFIAVSLSDETLPLLPVRLRCSLSLSLPTQLISAPSSSGAQSPMPGRREPTVARAAPGTA